MSLNNKKKEAIKTITVRITTLVEYFPNPGVLVEKMPIIVVTENTVNPITGHIKFSIHTHLYL
jgi:hypothetical protein